MMETFRLVKVPDPMIPGKVEFMHVQVVSLTAHDYAEDLITSRCVIQKELEFEIDRLIRELEKLKNRARPQWG